MLRVPITLVCKRRMRRRIKHSEDDNTRVKWARFDSFDGVELVVHGGGGAGEMVNLVNLRR